ncbi:DUF4416 family protein [Candidatus Dependentiae bacterium]|nr:DUF4416 family protein [Candidatus Dependentiae bacterium]
MGKILELEKVKLFCGIIFNPTIDLEEILNKLQEEFGEIDTRMPSSPFSHTEYYLEEFGEGLTRSFISFKHLIEKKELPACKHFTNNLENQYLTDDNKRRVNIDPGYIELSKIILASTKNFNHRIYIGDRIYAELTLIYKYRRFITLEWTYPDFKIQKHLDYLTRVRKIYKKQLNPAVEKKEIK